MTSLFHNKQKIISSKHIIPDSLGDIKHSEFKTFLQEQGKDLVKVINTITDHIQSMDPQKLREIEISTNLQFTRTTRDINGNVCFADDPDLRPEFRTQFRAIDLWDYYFALWNTAGRKKNDEEDISELPLPQSDQFWTMAKIGANFRINQYR